MATNPSSAGASWRTAGGSRVQTRDLRVANLVTDTLSIRDSILGNLAIGGALTVDELRVSGGGSVAGTMHMLDDLQTDGHARFGDDATVSGDLDVRGRAAVAAALALGDPNAALSGEVRPFLWSDGRGGVAVNSLSPAGFYNNNNNNNNSGVSALPATLCVSGALACPLIAATRQQAGRSVLVLAGQARGAGIAALADAGAGAQPAAARAALQFFAGTGAAVAAGASSAAPRSAAANDHDRPGAEIALDGGPNGGGALGVSARRLLLRAPAVAISRGRAAVATAAGTAPGADDLDEEMDVVCDDDVAALDAVARAPRPFDQTYGGKLEQFHADPWNERAMPGMLRTDLVLRAQQRSGGGFLSGGPARPLLVGAPLRASAPASGTSSNEQDVPGLAYLFAGARRGPDGHVGWRYGGGPAIDPDTLAGEEAAAGTVTRAPALVSGGAFVAAGSSSSSRTTHKRSAAQAGFLEPGLGPESLANFVPVLTQTQAPSRMRNRATVAVNAPLASADNRAALVVNGPTHLQSLDAAPLNLNTPFRLACDVFAAAVSSSAYGVAAHWDSAALPDEDPRFAPTNGQFGVVAGGRRVGRGYFRGGDSNAPNATTSSDPENASENGAFRYVAYVTVDGGQTWAESATDFVQATEAVKIEPGRFFAPIVCGPRSALVHDGRDLAYFTADRGLTWNVCAIFVVLNGMLSTPRPEEPNLPPRLVYVAPPTRSLGKHRVFFTGTPTPEPGAAAAVLLASPANDLTADFSVLSNPVDIDFAPTGLAGGVVVLGSGGSGGAVVVDDQIAIVLFSPLVKYLRIARAVNSESAGDGDVNIDRKFESTLLSNGGFCAAAVSTVRVGDIVAAAVRVSDGGSDMIIALSSDGGTSWTEFVAVSVDQLPPGFRPGTLAWMSPRILVALAADDSGNLGVSADRGRSWRFLAGPAASGLDLRLLRRSGLGAVLGPAAMRPRLLGLFRSNALPYAAEQQQTDGDLALPPAVLVCAAASNSAEAKADTATPAARDAGVAAAYALVLDALAPRLGAPLLRVGGSAAVEGDCRVDGDLRIGRGVQGDLRDDLTSGSDLARRRRRILLAPGASIEPDGVDEPGGANELRIGTSALASGGNKIVRIGRSGDTVVFEGQVVQAGGAAQVSDRTVVLNANNSAADSGGGAGIRVQEPGDGDGNGNGKVSGGFVRTAPNGGGGGGGGEFVGWDLKAPGSATVGRLALGALPTPTAAGALMLWAASNTSEVSGSLVARNELQADNLALLQAPNNARQTFTGPLAAPAGLSAGSIDVLGEGQALRVLAGDLLVSSGALVALGTGPGAGVRASTVSANLVSADRVSATALDVLGEGQALRVLTGDLLVTSGALVALGTGPGAGVRASTVSANLVSAGNVSAATGSVANDFEVRGALIALGGNGALGVNHTGVGVHTNGTVSAALVSASDMRAGGVISGNILSGNTLCGDTLCGDTLSGKTLSGDTVNGNTVNGGTVAAGKATVQSTLSKGGTVNEVATDPFFSLSGAAHSSFALFADGPSTTMLPALGRTKGGKSYIGGGGFAGAIGGAGTTDGAGTADGGGLRFVDLTPPTSVNAANYTAHQWMTNQGSAGGTGGLLALASLSKTGDLLLLQSNATLRTATVSAQTVSASTVSCGSVKATGDVSGLSLRAGTGGVNVAAGGSINCELLRNSGGVVTVSGALTVSGAGGIIVNNGGGITVDGGGGLSAATLRTTGNADILGALTAASINARSITLSDTNGTFTADILRGNSEVSGTLVRGEKGLFTDTVSALSFTSTATGNTSRGISSKNVYCTNIFSSNDNNAVFVEGLTMSVETKGSGTFLNGSNLLVMSTGGKTYTVPESPHGTFFLLWNNGDTTVTVTYKGNADIKHDGIYKTAITIGPKDHQFAFAYQFKVLETTYNALYVTNLKLN